MSSIDVWNIVADALVLCGYIAGPILLGIGAIGIAISVLQALTQVHEMTLSFAPKLIFLVLFLYSMGPNMSERFGAYSRSLHERAIDGR